jgi:ribosomal protein L29
MLNRKESDNATRASTKKELAKPRMAKSVRTAELNLEAERVPGQARTTLPGTVHKIIASLRTVQPEKAQIVVGGADDRYRDLRIENSLTDENGNEVSLKKRANVKVTVTAKPKK